MKKLLQLSLALTSLVAAVTAQDSIGALQADYQKAGQTDDRIDAAEMNRFAKRAVALAQTKGGKTGFDAVLWTFHICRAGEATHEEKKGHRTNAMAVLLGKYASTGRATQLIGYMVPRTVDEGIEFYDYLNKIVESTGNEEVKAAALARLGLNLILKERNVGPLGERQRAYAIKVLKRVREEFGDIQDPNDRAKRTYKESLAGPLFKIENLYIGATAPEIVGKDLDGVEFKLSDYRGKVVMLDFWGHW